MSQYKEYVKGKETIKATEKAFESVYKNQGFRPATKKEEQPDAEIEELGIKHSGSGWYELPNGEKVQGRDNAIEAVKEESNEDSSDEGDTDQEGDS